MRSAVATVIGVLVLAGCGGNSKHPAATRPASAGPATAGAAPQPTTTAAKCPFTVSLRAPGHHPKVNRNWTIRVSLRPPSLQGKPYYQFLLNGGVVSTQYVNGNRNFTFRGHYTDPQTFPPSSVGIALTFRVVVVTRCGTKHADYPVKVVT
jgi:hypothetical protein